MSTENDNFITLDSINEIQDIVNGDFIFTISNGQIYKLDFQNFIITRDNTDFFTLIDTLSAQVVTNTQSLCAINAYLNDYKTNTSDGLLGLSSTFTELSARWQSNYITTHSLSAQTWLPLPTEAEPFNTGSMVYYDGGVRDWKPIQSGTKNNVITVDADTGLPSFGQGTAVGAIETIATGVITVYTNDNITWSKSAAVKNTLIDETVSLKNITDTYSYIQVTYSLIPELTNNNVNAQNDPVGGTFSNSNVTLYNNGTEFQYVIPNGNKDSKLPMNITAQVTGSILPDPWFSITATIKLNYTITGTKIT